MGDIERYRKMDATKQTPVSRLDLQGRARVEVLNSEGNCEVESPHSNHAAKIKQSALYRDIATRVD